MIDISPEIQIKSTIRPGSVYYFPEETFTSDEPHYFIVINREPLADEIILLVCASSKIESVKRRRRDLPGTVVVIKKDEYPELARDSIVDCNAVITKRIEYLVLKPRQGRLRLKMEIDMTVVDRLRKAVMRSPRVEGEKKRFVSPRA